MNIRTCDGGECDLRPRRIERGPGFNAYAIACYRCGMTGPIALNLSDDNDETISRAWLYACRNLIKRLNKLQREEQS